MQYCLKIMKVIGMFEGLSYGTRAGKTEVLPALGDIRLFSE